MSAGQSAPRRNEDLGIARQRAPQMRNRLGPKSIVYIGGEVGGHADKPADDLVLDWRVPRFAPRVTAGLPNRGLEPPGDARSSEVP
jgi:hypothetical protein